MQRNSRPLGALFGALLGVACGARTGVFDLDEHGVGAAGYAGEGYLGQGGTRAGRGGSDSVGVSGSAAAGRGGVGAAAGAAGTAGKAGAGGSAPDVRVTSLGQGSAEHTCVVLSTGAVRCWGHAGNGELGYGNTNDIGDDETPASAGDVPIGGAVSQVAVGFRHTCALLTTRKVRCWGDGAAGKLGYGNTRTVGDDETPASVGDVDVGGFVTQISAGDDHTCALLTTGKVRCWGNGGDGALGYGNTNDIGDDETPASAGDVDVGGRVMQISAGGRHTCALLDSGALRCWGSDDTVAWGNGQLGYGDDPSLGTHLTIGDDETPASVGDVPVGGPVSQVTAGDYYTCALLATGNVRCWGAGLWGALGYGNPNNVGDNETPAAAGDVDVGEAVSQLSMGSHSTCALLSSGNVRCWGEAYDGELGYGTGPYDNIGDTESPASAGDVPIGGAVSQIAVGHAHACALLTAGTVRCWGATFHGQLGYPGLVRGVGQYDTPSSAGDVQVL
jgi:alpha-tubulin suppressor-like RCC1 family protein